MSMFGLQKVKLIVVPVQFLSAAKGQADLGITSVVLVSSTNVLILNQNSINQKTLPNCTADLVFFAWIQLLCLC